MTEPVEFRSCFLHLVVSSAAAIVSVVARACVLVRRDSASAGPLGTTIASLAPGAQTPRKTDALCRLESAPDGACDGLGRFQGVSSPSVLMSVPLT